MKRRQKKNPTSNLHVLLALRSRYLQNLPQAHLFFWQNNEGEYIKALPLLERQFLTPIPSCTGFKWEYMLGQCWVTPKDTSPCILLSSPGQEQEPGEEQNKHTVLLHTFSTSLDWNLLTQAQSSLNLCKTSQRETLPRKKTSQNYLLLLQKLTHLVWEICTAPHPYESVYTCTSSRSALFFNTSNKAKPAGNTDFPCHLQTIPAAPQQWPPASRRAAHLLTSSFLSLQQLRIYDREIPLLCQGLLRWGILFKTFLKSEYRLWARPLNMLI